MVYGLGYSLWLELGLGMGRSVVMQNAEVVQCGKEKTEPEGGTSNMREDLKVGSLLIHRANSWGGYGI